MPQTIEELLSSVLNDGTTPTQPVTTTPPVTTQPVTTPPVTTPPVTTPPVTTTPTPTGGLPDLTVDYSANSTSTVKGNDFVFNIITKNIGSAANMMFLYDRIDLDGQPIANIIPKNLPIGDMPANGSISDSYSLPTTNLAAGTHTITLTADNSDSSGFGKGVITESNESNNSKSFNFTVTSPATNPIPTPTPTGALPDLSITYASNNSSVVQGQTYSFEIYPSFPFNLPDSSIRISLDGKNELTFLDGSLPIIVGSVDGTIGVSGLKEKQFVQLNNLTIGKHTVTLTTDVNNIIAESNESNNSASFNFTVTAPTTSLPPGMRYIPSGNDGQAFRIYKAAFDRMPDASGLSYWTNILNSGKSLSAVADGFTHSQEFIAMYGTNPTAENFVTKVYNNVLHRAPEAGGYNYWVGIIHAGSLSQAGTLASISESAENQAAVLQLVGVNNVTY